MGEKLATSVDSNQWRHALSRISSEPELLNDKAYIHGLMLSFQLQGNVEALGQLLNLVATKQRSLGGLEGKVADAGYVNAFEYLLPPSIDSKLSQLNRELCREGDIKHLIRSFIQERNELSNYLCERADLVRDRTKNEYFLSQNIGAMPIFPYKYLADYAHKNIEPGYTPARPLNVEFIYCIKNRVERTTLSLRSLDEALENYRFCSTRGLSIKATVVEDVSHDVLDINSVAPSALPIEHHILDTQIGWTRSGLLNFGIKRSHADLLAFVDADFLFHKSFLNGLERALGKIDLSKNAVAVNLFETETHMKDGTRYSRGSPYSYMWMAPRKTVQRIGGFDEGYSGHGFEDRDFEMKLNRLGNLSICDTLSIDPECFVLHLSHEVRTGDERRQINRTRFLERQSGEDPNQLLQERWGEFTILDSKEYQPNENIGQGDASFLVDFLLVPHNSYHGRTFRRLRESLIDRGYTASLVDISPPHPQEGACPESDGVSTVPLSWIFQQKVSARALVFMNDWEGRVARKLITKAKALDIPTIAIVEGVNDFKDVDTSRQRRAYQSVEHLLLNGQFDRKYFETSDQDIRVAGIPRLDALKPCVQRSNGTRPHAPVALVNVNFSYGVKGECRSDWLSSVAAACEACGYEMVVSQHPADDADLSAYNRSDRPLYDLLAECDVFISRFSGAILEALALGTNVIYYNDGFEKVDKFMDPKGAYIWAKDQPDLELAMQYFEDGGSTDSTDFMKLHCDWSLFSREEYPGRAISKTAEHLVDILRSRAPRVGAFDELSEEIRRRFLVEGGFAPEVSESERERLISQTTIGIKSFGRSIHMRRLLESILLAYPEIRILVCDDSEEGVADLPQQVELLRPEQVDIGLSAGRNMLLEACETKYFVLLDDDFVFTKQTDILSLVKSLELYELDIAGGTVFDVGPSAQKKDQPRTFFGCLDIDADRSLRISTGKARRFDRNIPLYDLVLNFFACRTDVVRSISWDPDFKLGEHLDFFLRAKDENLRISYFPEIVIEHYRNHSENTEDYKKYRRRADHYHLKFKDLYSIKKIYQNQTEIPG